VEKLIKLERYDEAAIKLVSIVNDTKFTSARGKSHYQLWQELCELVVDHCEDIKSVQVEPIIRSGIKRFTDQVGLLYSRLAMYWIKMSQLEKVTSDNM
jgi:pre-mRNA-splicing factor SYF1